MSVPLGPWEAPPAPAPRRRRFPLLNAVLLGATVVTTLLAGAAFSEDGAAALARLASGRLSAFGDVAAAAWPYSAALMGFFLAHEMGHYLACRAYGVACTLPFFIPAPPFFLFGTFGAVIRIKGAIRDRRALFDIGVAGPLAGFAVSVPVLVVGLLRSRVVGAPPSGPAWIFGDSLLTWALQSLLYPDLGGADLEADPVFLAGWLGVLATAMNLIPAGQFDGGHIVYALWPRAHRAISLASGLFLASLVVTRSLVYGEVSAWSAWAVVVLVFGRRHPFVPGGRPGGGRLAVAAAALAILLLCFIPNPLGIRGL